MFSPAWWPRPQDRSTCGPLVCVREPCAAMRCALLTATLCRQLLQDSGPSPWAARSWLMSACCVELTTRDGRDAAGGGGGAAGAAATGLAGIADWMGLWVLARRLWSGSDAESGGLKDVAAAGCLEAARVCELSALWRASVTAPTLVATATAMRIPPNQETSRMADGRV